MLFLLNYVLHVKVSVCYLKCCIHIKEKNVKQII